LVLAWELFGFFGNDVPAPWSINYLIWVIVSSINFFLIYKYEKKHVTKDFLMQSVVEISAYVSVIAALLHFIGLNIYFLIGGGINVLISLLFYCNRKSLPGPNSWSLFGDIFRILAGNIGTVSVFAILHGSIEIPVLIIRASILVIDTMYVFKWIQRGHKISHLD